MAMRGLQRVHTYAHMYVRTYVHMEGPNGGRLRYVQYVQVVSTYVQGEDWVKRH